MATSKTPSHIIINATSDIFINTQIEHINYQLLEDDPNRVSYMHSTLEAITVHKENIPDDLVMTSMLYTDGNGNPTGTYAIRLGIIDINFNSKNIAHKYFKVLTQIKHEVSDIKRFGELFPEVEL